MKIKTSELTGNALDWAAAKANGDTDLPNFVIYKPHRTIAAEACFRSEFDPEGPAHYFDHTTDFAMWSARRYSTDWALGGKVIDEMMEGHFCFIESDGPDRVHVAFSLAEHDNFHGHGSTVLEAAMRCFVKSRLGEVVDVPEELFI